MTVRTRSNSAVLPTDLKPIERQLAILLMDYGEYKSELDLASSAADELRATIESTMTAAGLKSITFEGIGSITIKGEGKEQEVWDKAELDALVEMWTTSLDTELPRLHVLELLLSCKVKKKGKAGGLTIRMSPRTE